MQTLLQNSKLVDEQSNTVKVAVLKGDSSIQDLVAISFCDPKPVYFLSSVIPEVKHVRIQYLKMCLMKKCFFRDKGNILL